MEIEKIKITDIKPAEYNPRNINSEELTKLTNSISTFGLVDPIIINLKNNKIIGGHQRYEVLINQHMLNNDFYGELNLIRMGDIGWIFTETDLKVEDEDHEKALNLALNKISGEWDFEKLGEILDELTINEFNIDLTGFDEFEAELLAPDDTLLSLYDEEETENYDEVPEDYMDVEGDVPNQTYSVIFSFEDKEKANEFIKSLGVDKEMKQNSIVINQDELEIEQE